MNNGLSIQDTTGTRLFIRIDAGKLLPDSVFTRMDEVPAHLAAGAPSGTEKRPKAPEKVIIKDTISICRRNSIADITFYDRDVFLKNLNYIPPGWIRYKDAGNRGLRMDKAEFKTAAYLREGESRSSYNAHNDLILIIILFAAIMFLQVHYMMRNFADDVRRFFLFRGINEPSSREVSSLFTWQSTLLNFISFLVIALFGFTSLVFYGLNPAGVHSSLLIPILLVIVIFGITMRHLICTAAGNLSGNYDVFNEYLVNVYHSYRFSAMILFALVLIMTFTSLLSKELCIITGIASLGLIYFFRITRLSLIFIRRNISILYLILYLCALEILPLLILIRYFSQPGLS